MRACVYTHTHSPSVALSSVSHNDTCGLVIFVENTLPLIGASPDGLIEHTLLSHNTKVLEVVEVKCVSPFATARGPEGVLRINRSRMHHDGVPVWHIPQLQWEIFCAGPQCESALLIVLYIDGACIYRVTRDDEVSVFALCACVHDLVIVTVCSTSTAC